MASFAWAAIPTTWANMLPISIWPFVLILIHLHLSANAEGSEEPVRVPALGLTKADLIGELVLMHTLPTYQLALPFSQDAWRQLEYANGLIGTSC